jgi:hypothetical protein
MALPEVASPDAWLRPEHVHAVVERLRDCSRNSEGVDLARLATAPYATLEQHPTLTIEYSDEPAGKCAVYGHYNPNPRTIHVVRASTYGRDDFTLLHEYAHHLQQHDPEWAEIEWRIEPDGLRLRVTEVIANAFASTALIPDVLLANISPVPTARQMAELHQSVRASRQAVIVRVTRSAAVAAQAAGTAQHFFVSLTDADGVIVFSQMVGDAVFPPPRESQQPDVKRLFDDAVAAAGSATRVASEGVTYSGGSARSDIRLDLHLAHDGGYAFVVGTPEHRYGTARWTQQVQVCSSPACGNEFIVDETITRCRICGAPRCPECRTCECESTPTNTCQRCWTELSKVDIAVGRTDHADCA